VLGGVSDVAHFHYPTCTDSIKPNLQFSSIFLWLMLLKYHTLLMGLLPSLASVAFWQLLQLKWFSTLPGSQNTTLFTFATFMTYNFTCSATLYWGSKHLTYSKTRIQTLYKIDKNRICKESPTRQNWKFCRLGLTEPVHGRYWKVQVNVHVPSTG
jgi:hypothetical protein